ncbi:hypothetical protein MNBD_DELTA04-1099 [hydrothermal vent metagenome]|uniref:peptidylprolyl isomerase n=1 Tax=hydrothermal vent metagenome TaxID=652676 RepID=A0A3B0VZ09_9ZZZZ
MYKIIRPLTLAAILFFVCISPLRASWLPWSSSTLVTVNGTEYSADDFSNWWKNWREKGMSIPETPAPYVDWLLLYRQGEKMHLYNTPAYRMKVMVFLKARSLMMLKYDEVDSKIKISRQELWQRYLKSYVPRWQVNVISFHNKQDADAAYKKLLAGTVTVEELHKQAGSKGGAIAVKSRWQRPDNTNIGWQKILLGLGKKGFSKPTSFRNGVLILQLLSTAGADKKDFAKFREGISRKLWREKEGVYTNRLLQRLWKKYHVQVNRKLLKKLDVNTPVAALPAENIITMDEGSVSVKEFMQKLRAQRRFRREYGFKDAAFRYKEQVLDGIISQTLTTRAGLDRHYEKKPPFDKIFQFYTRHRLVMALEKQVFLPQVKVSAAEIKTFYNKNIREFSRPASFRLALIKGSRQEMKALWVETMAGGDFMTLARGKVPHGASLVHTFTEDDMDSGIKTAVAGLATKGDVSQVFALQGQYALVQLLDHRPADTLPLERVKDFIARQLKQDKLKAVRAGYLKKLRAASVIQVNDRVWQGLRQELRRKDEKK